MRRIFPGLKLADDLVKLLPSVGSSATQEKMMGIIAYLKSCFYSCLEVRSVTGSEQEIKESLRNAVVLINGSSKPVDEQMLSRSIESIEKGSVRIGSLLTDSRKGHLVKELLQNPERYGLPSLKQEKQREVMRLIDQRFQLGFLKEHKGALKVAAAVVSSGLVTYALYRSVIEGVEVEPQVVSDSPLLSIDGEGWGSALYAGGIAGAVGVTGFGVLFRKSLLSFLGTKNSATASVAGGDGRRRSTGSAPGSEADDDGSPTVAGTGDGGRGRSTGSAPGSEADDDGNSTVAGTGEGGRGRSTGSAPGSEADDDGNPTVAGTGDGDGGSSPPIVREDGQSNVSPIAARDGFESLPPPALGEGGDTPLGALNLSHLRSSQGSRTPDSNSSQAAATLEQQTKALEEFYGSSYQNEQAKALRDALDQENIGPLGYAQVIVDALQKIFGDHAMQADFIFPKISRLMAAKFIKDAVMRQMTMVWIELAMREDGVPLRTALDGAKQADDPTEVQAVRFAGTIMKILEECLPEGHKINKASSEKGYIHSETVSLIVEHFEADLVIQQMAIAWIELEERSINIKFGEAIQKALTKDKMIGNPIEKVADLIVQRLEQVLPEHDIRATKGNTGYIHPDTVQLIVEQRQELREDQKQAVIDKINAMRTSPQRARSQSTVPGRRSS